MKPIHTLLILLVCIAPAAIARTPGANPALYSSLWLQTSAEYQALCLQAYRQATERLPQALADPSWTAMLEQQQMPVERYRELPPGVVLDVDETLLSTGAYQARAVLAGGHSPALWDRWLARAEAPAVPGALAFVQRAKALGIRPLYVTNRRCTRRSGRPDPCPQQGDTLRNLKQAGFPASAEQLLLLGERPGWDREKTHRRRFLAEHYRVLLLVGDDLGDFLAGVGTPTSPEARLQRMEPRSRWWGQRWLVLPNPVYGSWRRALGGTPADYLEPSPLE
jgi:acid phosphatase